MNPLLNLKNSHKLTLLFIVVFGVFCPLLFLFFHSEDFYFLYWGGKSPVESISLFANPIRPIFRPLSRMLYWQIFVPFFGFKFYLYHFLHLIIHCTTIYFFYRCLQILRLLDPSEVFFATFLFGLTPLAAVPIGWISAIQDLTMVLFSTLALYSSLYLHTHQKVTWRGVIYGPLFYLLALLSKEQALFLPLLIVVLNVFTIHSHHSKRKKCLFLFPYLVIFIIYSLYIFVFKLVPQQGPYSFEYSSLVFLNFFKYLASSFLFGIELTNDVIWGIMLTVVIFIIHRKDFCFLLLNFCWFIVFLLPVLFMKNHFFSYYGYFSAGACAILIAKSLSPFWEKRKFGLKPFLYLFVLIVSFCSIWNMKITHPLLNSSHASFNLWHLLDDEKYCNSDAVLVIWKGKNQFIFLSGFGSALKLRCPECDPELLYNPPQKRLENLSEKQLLFITLSENGSFHEFFPQKEEYDFYVQSLSQVSKKSGEDHNKSTSTGSPRSVKSPLKQHK